MKKWFKDWTPLPADMIVQVAPVLAALLVALLFFFVVHIRGHQWPVFIMGVLAGIVGVVLLFCARLPLYRQHQFFTFGSRQLDPAHRRLYRLAYLFVIVSCLLLVGLLLAVGLL